MSKTLAYKMVEIYNSTKTLDMFCTFMKDYDETLLRDDLEFHWRLLDAAYDIFH